MMGLQPDGGPGQRENKSWGVDVSVGSRWHRGGSREARKETYSVLETVPAAEAPLLLLCCLLTL